MLRSRSAIVGGLSVLLLAACKEKPDRNLAPVASALGVAVETAKSVARITAAQANIALLAIERDSSQLRFTMQAPIEKISGEADAALEGQLVVDTSDLSKSTGLVRADLTKLVLYQEQRVTERGKFGARTRNELQNQHARTWLEISEDVPEQLRADYAKAEFQIRRLENLSSSNLAQLSGDSRKVTALAVGDFRLHGRKSEKRAQVELTFGYAGERLNSVRVVSLTPLQIGLEEYDVRPREAFGKLAQKTLSALGSKVAESVPIQIVFEARRP